MRIELVIFCFIALFLVKGKASQEWDHESRLRNDMLSKLPTDIESRPMPTKNTTDLTVFLIVTHIIGLDERTETFSLNGWMFMMWDDERFQWDPANYGGITNLRIPENSVWKPMFMLSNSASFSKLTEFKSVARPIVNYQGWVRWVPAITVDSICAMDFRWFPFDEHNCTLMFGCWYKSGYEVNVKLPEQSVRNIVVDFGDTHNEWELLASGGEREVFNAGADYEWHAITFYLIVRRSSSYYQLTLMVPSVLSILMTLGIFWIPISCKTQKFTLTSFNIIFLTILLVQIYRVIPRSGSSIPSILLLNGNSLALAGTGLLFTTIILYISQRSDRPVPPVVQQYLNGYLGVALCMKLPVKKGTLQEEGTADGQEQVASNQMEVGDPWGDSAKMKQNASQWMIVATALDRICFAVFAFTYFIVLIVAFT